MTGVVIDFPIKFRVGDKVYSEKMQMFGVVLRCHRGGFCYVRWDCTAHFVSHEKAETLKKVED